MSIICAHPGLGAANEWHYLLGKNSSLSTVVDAVKLFLNEI